MKRVIIYKVPICYKGFVYDLTNLKFRNYLIKASSIDKDNTNFNKVKYMTDNEAFNIDGKYNFFKVPDESLVIVSWAEIDKSFDYEEAMNDLKTIIQYHDFFHGHQSERNLQSILEMICQFNKGD